MKLSIETIANRLAVLFWALDAPISEPVITGNTMTFTMQDCDKIITTLTLNADGSLYETCRHSKHPEVFTATYAHHREYEELVRELHATN